MFRSSPRARARRLTAGAARKLERDRPEAERLYREALQLDAGMKAAWFDLGLICKWEGRWEEAFDCNLRAAELEGEQPEEPAWWNLGIAATALRRWDVARRAWAVYGIEIAPGIGPIEDDFGMGPVRLNPEDDGEVVWGHRIDPTRMRIVSIPFPQSGHRWGDVVLHDGAPNGYRELDGESLPVFDELERWEASEVPTVEATVSVDDVDAVDELVSLVGAAGYVAEDWTQNVRLLCRQCSEGQPHGEHSDAEIAAGPEHLLGLAAPLEAAERLLAEWESAGRKVIAVQLSP
jgi:tetratricopeptide (TPR) repeat protein